MLLVMDIRREWSEDEQLLLDLADKQNLQFGLILSKSDQLSKSAVMAKKNKINQELKLDLVLPYSSLSGDGLVPLEKVLFDWLLA